MKKNLFLMAIIFSIGGCSTTKFSCPYGESCADITDIYKAAKTDPNPKGWSVTKDPTREKSNENTASFDDLDEIDGYMDNSSMNEAVAKNKAIVKVKKSKLKTPQKDALSAAVFHPEKPYQIWLAPWIDSNKILHSGSYAWFTTPSYWTYAGEMVSNNNVSSASNADEGVDFDIEPYYKEGPAPSPNNTVMGNLGNIANQIGGGQ